MLSSSILQTRYRALYGEDIEMGNFCEDEAYPSEQEYMEDYYDSVEGFYMDEYYRSKYGYDD